MAIRGWIAVLTAVCALVATPAWAQGGSTASLSGVVTDKDGGIVPGATVTIKNNATGETMNTVTNSSGAWSLPGLSVGTYTVTVSLTGFKTSEHTGVRLNAGSQNTLQTKLDVGQFSDVMTISGRTDLIRTETPTVSSTINADFITTLPRADRNALNFLIFMPGVQTIGGAGSARSSTVSGLPQNTINITIDGISNSNLLQSGDGFFSMVVPRLDAIEEVTMTTATAGANATGQGAVQIAFQTRSGTNRFETSLYNYIQHAMFNSNTFFNRLNGLEKPQNTNWIYGGRVGGPIIIPGVFDGRGKAFFFFNYEEVYNPIETARQRSLIRQSALDGNFTYNQTTPRTVNLWALAAQHGQITSYDPQIKTLLESMRSAAGTTGTIVELVTSPNRSTFNYPVPNKGVRHNPVTSITVNITPKHRLQGSYHHQVFSNSPDTLNNADQRYPGFPAYGDQVSFRTSGSISLRSTLSASMVNELRGGWQWSPLGFFDNATPAMFENQGGFGLALGFSLENAHPGGARAPSQRNTIPYSIDNTFSWLKGSHSMSFGGNFTRLDDWADNWDTVPAITLGFNQTNDPAELAGMFSSTNFPGSSSGDRNEARALYALLTGRVATIAGTGRLNEAGTEYIYNGHAVRRERMDEYSFFAQDQWRWKPTITVTGGLRYQLQMPMKPTNGVFTTNTTEAACGPSGFGNGPHGIFCNIFNPGSLLNPNVKPEFFLYEPNRKGYNTDTNNIAPNVGISWRPNVQDGFMRTLLGDPEIATLTAGFSRSYNRERIDRFLDVFSGNPGQTVPATRGTGSTNFPLVLPGESWPILYSQKSRLGPPAFQTQPIFPLPAATNQDMLVFDPNITIPYADSWSVSLQRSLDRDTVAEVRYVGNVNKGAWISLQDWNDANPYETGLLKGEFELAQKNLQANVNAGLGGTFAYTGAPGTSPLPLFLAHLTTTTCPRGACAAANNPASYTGTQWTNSTWTDALDPFFPDPHGLADDLYSGNSGTWFNNAKAQGYPINYWVLNPLVSDVGVTRNNPGGVRNHQFIGEVRRRLNQGLAVNLSYTYAYQHTESIQDFHLPLFDLRNTGVPHAFKMIWTYDIPYGRGKRYGANINPVLDYIVGGWTFSGAGRVQVQSFVVRNSVLVGMTKAEAQQLLMDVRFTPDPVTGAMRVYNMPAEIITQTQRAYNTDPTQPGFYAPGTAPTGQYFAPAGGPDCNFIEVGDCNTQDLWFRGRWFGEFDFRLAKMVPVKKARVEVSAEIFNALMAKNFPTVVNPGPGDIFRITSTQSGARTAQLVFRVSW